ncbi:putative ribonuclease H-like domain-containing protein [Tanacetum coccineum]
MVMLPIEQKLFDGKRLYPSIVLKKKAQRRAELKAEALAVNTAQGVNTARTQGVADSSTTIENLIDVVIKDAVHGPTRKELGLTSPKVECFTDKRGHFARSAGTTSIRHQGTGIYRRIVPVEENTSNALVSQYDDFGYDWSDQCEEVNYVSCSLKLHTVGDNEPETFRKEKGVLIIEDWVSERDEENVPKVKTLRCLRHGGLETKAQSFRPMLSRNNDASYPLKDLDDIDERQIQAHLVRKNRSILLIMKKFVEYCCLWRKPALSFMRPFGYPVTILNTIDHLGKFDGKANEGFFVGYSTNSKAFKVFNSRTKIVEENLHVQFSKNTSNIAGSGPIWIFDIDALTNSMNYKPVVAGNQSNGNAGTKACDNAGFKPLGEEEKTDTDDPRNENATSEKDSEVPSTEEPREDQRVNQELDASINSTNNIKTASDGSSTNNVNTVNSTINAAITEVNAVDPKTSIELPNDPNMPKLEDIVYSDDDEDVSVEADMNNLDAFIDMFIPYSNYKIHIMQQRTNHKDFQNCRFSCFLSQVEPKKVIQDLKDPSWIEAMQEELLQFKLPQVYRNKKDERGIVIRNKARLVAQGHTQEVGIDYDEVFAPVARIVAIRLFLAYASYKDFEVYQMDVKSAFLYGKIEEEVYVCQPPGFEDLDFPNRVYKVEKALYGLHQAPRA